VRKEKEKKKILFFFPFGIFPHVLSFFGINKKKPVFSSFLLLFSLFSAQSGIFPSQISQADPQGNWRRAHKCVGVKAEN